MNEQQASALVERHYKNRFTTEIDGGSLASAIAAATERRLNQTEALTVATQAIKHLQGADPVAGLVGLVRAVEDAVISAQSRAATSSGLSL